MNFNRLFRIMFCFVLVLCALGFAYADFPQVVFTQTEFGSGRINLSGEVSSGTEILLYVNEDYVDKRVNVAGEKFVELLGSVENEEVGVGQKIVFFNNVSGRVYKMNFSGQAYKEIAYRESVSFSANEPGDVLFRDEEEGISRVLSVVDLLVNFSFENVEDKFYHGENDVSFVLKYPLPLKEQSLKEDFVVFYQKFSNEIVFDDIPELTNSREVRINGTVSEEFSPLYYVVNQEVIGNLGILKRVELDGNYFDVVVSGLSEGENEVRFVSVESEGSNVINGEVVGRVVLDTVDPRIDFAVDLIVEGENFFTNEDKIRFDVSTDDGVVLNYTFNGEEFGVLFDEEKKVGFDLDLVLGKNNLTLRVWDAAGNSPAPEVHTIFFDDETPKIVDDSLRPQEMFRSGGVSHFPFEKIEGQTNKGNVKMTIFSLSEDAKDFEGNRVTCSDYEKIYVRNLGQLDREGEDEEDVGINLDEYQVSLWGLVNLKEEVYSDEDGNFEATIALQEREFERGDITSETQKIGSVRSPNVVCFILEDRFGNVEVAQKRVVLDIGNSLWRPVRIDAQPSILYPAEIEQAGDVRAGRAGSGFGLCGFFQYVGAGEVSTVTNVNLGFDKSGFVSLNGGFLEGKKLDVTDWSLRVTEKEIEKAKGIFLNANQEYWVYNKEDRELVVCTQVGVKPLGIEPLKYPDNLVFPFEMRVVYSVDEKDIPIDSNPIFFKVDIGLERPIDHSKWLTPQFIDDALEFLNRSITYTEKAVDYLGIGSVAGVIGCTGARLWYGGKVALIRANKDLSEPEKQEELNEAKQRLFYICDRVACSASPAKCEGTIGDFEGGGDGILNLGSGKSFYSREDLTKTDIRATDAEGGDVLVSFDNLRIGNECNYSSSQKGKLVSGDISTYSQDKGFTDLFGSVWNLEGERGSVRFVNKCVPVSKNGGQIDLKGASDVCYQEGAPNFDETRCLGGEGFDPADNIIESIRCGCITDTYSHTKNLLKIQLGIYGCLQQAKIGNVKGSYCERLMGQAVCDLATNFIFKTAFEKRKRGSTEGDSHTNIFTAALGGLNEGDRVINERYRGTFLTQAGFSSQDIVNKMCLVGITGDWSIMTDNILSSIDKNEVEPVFGPTFPESRILGYNPLTGDLSIQYRFTYGVVSGGQAVRTKVTFICDKSRAGGDYCPDGYHTSDDLGSDIDVRNLYVRERGSAQDTIVVTDAKARYWFNVLRLEHEYNLKGNVEKKIQEEVILQKSEFNIAQCFFGVGSGFSCDKLFGADSLVSSYKINGDNSYMSPKPDSGTATYYPGNKVVLNLAYDVRDVDLSSGGSFDLAYKAVCEGVGDAKATQLDYKRIDVSGVGFGRALVDLFAVPTIGETYEGESTRYYINLNKNEADLLNEFSKDENSEISLKFTNVAGTVGKTFRIKSSSFGSQFNVHIGQSFTVNAGAGNPTASVVIKSVGKDADANYRQGEDFFVELEGGVSNVQVEIVMSGKTSSVLRLNPERAIEIESVREFDRLQEGRCSVGFKILPAGNGPAAVASSANFEKYSPSGEEVILSKALQEGDYYEDSFVVARRPTAESTQSFNFEFVTPYVEESICLDDTTKSFDLEYLYETSFGSDVFDMRIDYSVSSFGGKFEGGSKRLSYLKGSLPVSVVESLEVGKASDAVLSYNLVGKEGGKKDGKVKTLKSNTIKFKIYRMGEGEKCPVKTLRTEHIKLDESKKNIVSDVSAAKISMTVREGS